MKKLFAAENILNLLLVFVPIAFYCEFVLHNPIMIFISSALAIIPLAGFMGKATEHLSEKLGDSLGGLLNATFGNAAELIIAIIGLQKGLYDVVKASITGSIIGNVLLVFGLSCLAGGVKHSVQKFNKTAASTGATMLALSAAALLIPAIVNIAAGSSGKIAEIERNLSLEISIVLIVTYILGLFFSLKTHKHLYVPEMTDDDEEAVGTHGWSIGKSGGVLLAATAAVAVMSEFLVGAIDEAAKKVGMSEVFVGVILVAIIGNAAEHSTAVLVAMKNKMDLAMNVAVGSSIQIALFVAPVLVFTSYFVGAKPMDLLFSTLEVVAITISVAIMALISQDGESNWMEGVQMLAVYIILGIAFFNLPL